MVTRETISLTLPIIPLSMLASIIVVLVVEASIGVNGDNSYSSPWHYKCEAGLCKKEAITNETDRPNSLQVCELFCGASSSLWPKATGHLSLSKTMVQLDPDKISFDIGSQTETRVAQLLRRNLDSLRENAKRAAYESVENGGIGMTVRFAGFLQNKHVKLSLNTDESYTLNVTRTNEALEAWISAKSYFGARHAVETLNQLIVFDDLRNQIQIPSDIAINDGPVYPYRGILLDTSRNYVDKATILRTIDGMSMSKLNTLHWHIVDSQSFPYVSKSWPDFSKYGAYSSRNVYTERDVKEIVEHGIYRGVRVLPEFDAPAHVGEGWQWVGEDAILCFKAEPWKSYCVEPPCGQLNPASETVYQVLEGIYKDMLQDFQPDLFHMGGDEVNINCWNSSTVLTTWMQKDRGWNLSESSFYMLWDYFQQRALDKLTLANAATQIPVILWTSGLTTEENIRYLDPDKYIVQIWTSQTDPTIGRLLRNNFRVIFSNYDALYLDCGFSAWVGEGNNWCAPYKGWQTIYENSPLKIVGSQRLQDKKNLILGGEAALWTEEADSATVDSRIWPRSAALAERLWAEPNSTWFHAEQRMLRHRNRYAIRGISAESLQPEWCLQNQGHCYA